MAVRDAPLVLPASDKYRTASVLLLRSLFSYARSIGVDVDRVLHALRIPPALLEDRDARVPQATLSGAWAEVGTASADQALGLHYAEQAEEGDFGVLEYAAYFSSSLRDVVDRVARFYRLLSDALAIEVLADGDATRITRLVGGTDPQEREAFFAVLCVRLRNLGGREIRPREVSFEHASHARRELEGFFGCPVHFGRAHSELVLASSDLDRPGHAAKPRLAALLDRYATELLARLPATGSYADHVRRSIAHVIQREPPTLEAIARQMHASRRTVQRRLSDAGTTHKHLVEEVRRQLALRYIATPELSIVEIAYLLGYQEESSFRRAFKKWTGKSPSQARHG